MFSTQVAAINFFFFEFLAVHATHAEDIAFSIHGSAPVPFRWLCLQKLSDTRNVHVHHEVCVCPLSLSRED